MQTRPLLPDEKVMSLIRPVLPVYRESSLASAVEALRESGAEAAPVLDGSFVVGAIWAKDIRAAVLAGEPLDLPLIHFLEERPPRLLPNATLEEARAVLAASGAPAIIISDPEGRYVGLLSALDLYHRPEALARPPYIGGMATPFGVFLTNGETSGGAGPFALAATGAMLFGLLFFAVLVTAYVLEAAGTNVSMQTAELLFAVMPPALFFVMLRALPLSGTHGAEHMVVHAIERREPLNYEIVRRMPRVHPRCGTNLAIGAMIFMGLVGAIYPVFGPAGALFSLVATMTLWRPIGSIFQLFITTKNPSKPQLLGAMKAGEELLARYKQNPRPMPSFGRRLVMSGLPWVFAGAVFAFVVLYLLLHNADIPAVARLW